MIEFGNGKIELHDADHKTWFSESEILSLIFSHRGKIARAWAGDIELTGPVQMVCEKHVVDKISQGMRTLVSTPPGTDPEVMEFQLAQLDAIMMHGIDFDKNVVN